MKTCNALVFGKNARLNCGDVAVTSFHDPIDGTIVYCCKRHAKGYRQNPLTWKERPIDAPGNAQQQVQADSAGKPNSLT